MPKQAFVNFQERATEFSVGDCVRPFLNFTDASVGRVVAVWPAIGMVDVEWPHGNGRMPVEELTRCTEATTIPPTTENVPGGVGSVPVPDGPQVKSASAQRVAEAYVKKALYWVDADRQYRATRSELDGGSFTCPKCKSSTLKKAIYRRMNGQSEHLLGCPQCLFLVLRNSIKNHPEV